MCFLGLHKWGELKDDKQTCLKCGKIIYVNPCSSGHTLVTFGNTYDPETDNSNGFLQKCVRCGKIYSFNPIYGYTEKLN